MDHQKTIIIIVCIFVLVIDTDVKVKKYFRFTASNPAIFLIKKDSDSKIFNVKMNIEGEIFDLFQDILDENKYQKNNPVKWNIIKSIRRASSIFIGIFSGEIKYHQCPSIHYFYKFHVNGEFDLTNHEQSILFYVNILITDLDCKIPYTLISISYLYKLKSHHDHVKVTINPYIVNQHIHPFMNFFTHDSTYNHLIGIIRNFFIYNSSLIGHIEKTNMKVSYFNFKNWFKSEISDNKNTIIQNKPPLKIYILPEKYYSLSIPDNFFTIQLVIHCDFYKTDNPSKSSGCVRGKLFYCDKFGKQKCENRNMKDPPLCQKGINDDLKIFYDNFDENTKDIFPNQHYVKIICNCGENIIYKYCNYKSFCLACTKVCEEFQNSNDENNKFPIISNMCKNGATHTLHKNKMVCVCPAGYIGKQCELECGFICKDNSCSLNRDAFSCGNNFDEEKKTKGNLVTRIIESDNVNYHLFIFIYFILIVIAINQLVHIFYIKLRMKRTTNKIGSNLNFHTGQLNENFENMENIPLFDSIDEDDSTWELNTAITHGLIDSNLSEKDENTNII